MYSQEFLNQPEIVALRNHIVTPHEKRHAANLIQAELRQPLPKYPENMTRCRVLTANFHHREGDGELFVPPVDSVINMPKVDAKSMQALGRVQILTGNKS